MNHAEKLADMYNVMPFNQDLKPHMTLEEGKAEVVAKVDPKFFHGGGITHGAVIFRLLDDACSFAAWTLVLDKACVTKDLQIEYLKPINKGTMTAKANVLEVVEGKNEIKVEAELYNDDVLASRCTATIARLSSKIKQIDEVY